VHQLRQLEAELVLQDVGDAALSRLGVDPDDRAVAAADVGGIDRDVEDVPGLPGLLVREDFLMASWCEPLKAVNTSSPA
jgi:hypothetical protein